MEHSRRGSKQEHRLGGQGQGFALGKFLLAAGCLLSCSGHAFGHGACAASEEEILEAWDAWLVDHRAATTLAEQAELAEGVLEVLEETLATLGEATAARRQWPYSLHQHLGEIIRVDEEVAQVVWEHEALVRLRDFVLSSPGGSPFRGGTKAEHLASEDQFLAHELVKVHRFEDAQRVLGPSLEALHEYPVCVAFLMAARANAYRIQGRWSEARECLDQADELHGELGFDDSVLLNPTGRRLAAGVRTQLEMLLGRMDHAWSASEQERREAQRFAEVDTTGFSDFDVHEANTHWLELMMAVGRYEDILEQVAPMLAAARPGEEAHETYRLLRARALVKVELGKASGGAEARRELESIVDRNLLSPIHLQNAQLDLAELALEAGDLDSLARHIALAKEHLETGGVDLSRISRDRTAAAVAAMEALHARLQGAPADVLDSHLRVLESATGEMVASWRATSVLPGGVGYLFDNRRRNILGTGIELAVEMGAEERALDLVLRVQSQGAVSRSLQVPVPGLGELEDKLLQGGGCLVYVPTLRGTHLLALDRGGVEHYRLARSRQLENLVQDVQFGLQQGDGDSAALGQLSRELFPEGLRRRMADWEHVYISGGELLKNPPFELLPFGGGRLGRELALSHVPSLPLAVHLAKSDAPSVGLAPGSVGFFAGPVNSTVRKRWPALLDLDLGAEAWDLFLGNLPVESVQSWTGAAATRGSVLGCDMGNMQILHVFAHGVFDGQRDIPAGLVLSDTDDSDGLLWSEDIQGMDVPALVVLAACGAARGPERFGEDGSQHLGGAFLRAGARAVLLSRGDLEAASTLEVMRDFNSQVALGDSPMEALRKARELYARRHGDDLVLAPLMLIGAADRPLVARGSSVDQLLLALGGLGLLAATLLLLRRRSTPSP